MQLTLLTNWKGIDLKKLTSFIISLRERRKNELNDLAKKVAETQKTEQKETKRKRAATTFKRKAAKVGRNDPCPCGSGKKFKKCCLNKDSWDAYYQNTVCFRYSPGFWSSISATDKSTEKRARFLFKFQTSSQTGPRWSSWLCSAWWRSFVSQ